MSAANPVLVEVWRGTAVESRHRGAYVVLDGAGGQVAAAGEGGGRRFPRPARPPLPAPPPGARRAPRALVPE